MYFLPLLLRPLVRIVVLLNLMAYGTRQRFHMGSRLPWNTNRKSYLAYQTQPLACCCDDRNCPKWSSVRILISALLISKTVQPTATRLPSTSGSCLISDVVLAYQVLHLSCPAFSVDAILRGKEDYIWCERVLAATDRWRCSTSSSVDWNCRTRQ